MTDTHKKIMRCVRLDWFIENCIDAIAKELHCSKSDAIRKSIIVVRILFDENLKIGDVLKTLNPEEKFASNIENLNIIAKRAKIYTPYEI